MTLNRSVSDETVLYSVIYYSSAPRHTKASLFSPYDE